MLSERAHGEEYLDRPDVDRHHAENSYRFMRWVNRYLGGTRAVRQYIRSQPPGPLRVLDIGAGVCDIPLSVTRGARAGGRGVEFTCLETNDDAIRVARQEIRHRRASGIRVVAEDVWAHRPAAPYDCAVGSMFFHHLPDDQILALLAHLRTFVRRSVLINDLRRTAGNYAGCLLATALLPPKVRHDALLSVRRSFRPGELRTLLEQMENVQVEMHTLSFSRLATVVRFEQPDLPG
ncbi:MAG: methyltransferase domain-containing protein [Planctomycetota bacterium]